MEKDVLNYAIETINDYITENLNIIVSDNDKREIARKAYNKTQENEHGGVDYIFNIYDQNDFTALVTAGLTASDVKEMVCGDDVYFFYNTHYEKPEPLSVSDVAEIITSCALDVTQCALKNPKVYEYAEWLFTFFGLRWIIV